MVDRPEEAESGPSLVVAGTQLGTVAKSQLLEDQWRLVDLIGRGQTGEVWHAHDVQLDRAVAVKLMHPELANDPQQVLRFEREARVLAGVEHPNLLPVLGSGRSGGRPFLVTRLLDGKTLAEVMHQRGGRVPAPEVARILIPICDALAALHDSGVVHRDLKPSNVFVGTDQSVTLMDLGSAREAGSELTRFGEVLGTDGYLSPEQRNGGPLDGKSDVYGVGCLLREALTGSLAPVERTDPGVPAALLALARKATSENPADRPTVAELKAGLQPYLTTEEATAPMAAPLRLVPDPPKPDGQELPTQAVVFTPTTGSPEYPHLRALQLPVPEATVSTASTQVFDQPVAVATSSTLVLPKSSAVSERVTVPRLSQRSKAALGVGAFFITAAFGVGLLEQEPVAPPPVRIDKPAVEVSIAPEEKKTLTIQRVEPPKEDRVVVLPQLEERKAWAYEDHGYGARKKPKVNHSNVAFGKLRVTTTIDEVPVTAQLFTQHPRDPNRWVRRGPTPIEIPVTPSTLVRMQILYGSEPYFFDYPVLSKKEWKLERGGMHFIWELRNPDTLDPDPPIRGDRVGAGDRPAGQPMTGLRRGAPR